MCWNRDVTFKVFSRSSYVAVIFLNIDLVTMSPLDTYDIYLALNIKKISKLYL